MKWNLRITGLYFSNAYGSSASTVKTIITDAILKQGIRVCCAYVIHLIKFYWQWIIMSVHKILVHLLFIVHTLVWCWALACS